MLMRLLLVALLGLSLASAKTKTYDFRLTGATQVGSAKLDPGDYSLKVNGDQVILKDSTGHEIPATAKIETGSEEFRNTEVSTTQTGGTNKVEWIGLGGSKSKVIFQ